MIFQGDSRLFFKGQCSMDEREKQLEMQREALAALKKAGVGKTFGVMALFMVMFFSGFAAFGTFVISQMDKSWYAKAAIVDGSVLSKRMEERVRHSTDTEGRPRTTRTAVTVLTVTYQPGQGAPMTRSVDAGNRVYDVGETVRLAYQPNDPADVKLYQPNNVGMLENISKVAGGIFAAAFALFFIATRKSRDKAV